MSNKTEDWWSWMLPRNTDNRAGQSQPPNSSITPGISRPRLIISCMKIINIKHAYRTVAPHYFSILDIRISNTIGILEQISSRIIVKFQHVTMVEATFMLLYLHTKENLCRILSEYSVRGISNAIEICRRILTTKIWQGAEKQQCKSIGSFNNWKGFPFIQNGDWSFSRAFWTLTFSMQIVYTSLMTHMKVAGKEVHCFVPQDGNAGHAKFSSNFESLSAYDVPFRQH